MGMERTGVNGIGLPVRTALNSSGQGGASHWCTLVTRWHTRAHPGSSRDLVPCRAPVLSLTALPPPHGPGSRDGCDAASGWKGL